jgi:hypothetical protein
MALHAFVGVAESCFANSLIAQARAVFRLLLRSGANRLQPRALNPFGLRSHMYLVDLSRSSLLTPEIAGGAQCCGSYPFTSYSQSILAC